MNSPLPNHFEQTPERIRIRLFENSTAGGCFLALMASFLTIVCVIGSFATISDTEPPVLLRLFLVLFLVPFWGMANLVAYGAGMAWFRRDEFRLTKSGVTYIKRGRRSRSVQRIPLTELIDFRGADSYVAGDGPMIGVEVVTTGKALYFEPNLPNLDDRHLIQRLNRRLEELRQRRGVPAPPDGSLADCRNCPLPSGVTWRETADSDGVTLVRREDWPRFARSAVVGFSVYWFIHVIPIVAQTIQKMADGTFREEASRGWIATMVAGLGSAGVAWLVYQLRNPFRVARWRVTETEVECVARHLGATTVRRFRQDSLRQIVLVDAPLMRRAARSHAHRRECRDRTAYQISARDRAGGESWRIGRLTLGEALWIKGRIQAHVTSVAIPTPEASSSSYAPPTIDVPVRGRRRELALCIECLEPLGLIPPDRGAGVICPSCGVVQSAHRRPEPDLETGLREVPPAVRSRVPGLLDPDPPQHVLPAGIEVERPNEDGLRFSVPLIDSGPVRRHGPWVVAGWGLIVASVLVWSAWVQGRGDDGIDPLFFFIPQFMAAAVVVITSSIAILIAKGRMTVDLDREGLLIRWGWGILSTSSWAPLDAISGFRMDRLTGGNEARQTFHGYQRPVGAAIVHGRSWGVAYGDRSSSIAVLRVLQAKLRELRGGS